MDMPTLGSKLTTYRTNLRFSLKEVAKLSKLPVSTINDYETGKIQKPDFNKIEQLCKIYGISLSVLIAAVEPVPTIHFRLSNFSLTENEEQRIEDLLTFIDDYENVFELLGEKKDIYLHRTYPNDPSLNWFELGNRIAMSERKYWGYFITQPVDLLPSIQNEGILVNFIELPESIDGFFYMSANSKTFWIFVNANKPGARKNFTLAHEYAHFLLDRDQKNYVCNITRPGSDPLESRANAVAARILVPRPALENRVSKKMTPDKVIELCHVFGVSSDVINYRLIDEGFVSKRKGQELLQYDYTSDRLYRVHMDSIDKKFDVPKLDLSFRSPNPVQEEFLVKVTKAYGDGKITFSRALSYFRNKKMAELLGVFPKEPEELQYIF
jgi:Zn-dependent peptidase ImmA (M78 family)